VTPFSALAFVPPRPCRPECNGASLFRCQHRGPRLPALGGSQLGQRYRVRILPMQRSHQRLAHGRLDHTAGRFYESSMPQIERDFRLGSLEFESSPPPSGGGHQAHDTATVCTGPLHMSTRGPTACRRPLHACKRVRQPAARHFTCARGPDGLPHAISRVQEGPTACRTPFHACKGVRRPAARHFTRVRGSRQAARRHYTRARGTRRPAGGHYRHTASRLKR
jgi:hypothetical protein